MTISHNIVPPRFLREYFRTRLRDRPFTRLHKNTYFNRTYKLIIVVSFFHCTLRTKTNRPAQDLEHFVRQSKRKSRVPDSVFSQR